MKNFLYNWWVEILAVIGFFLAPIINYAIYITLLVIVDLVTGILKARKKGLKENPNAKFNDYLQSKKLSHSLTKWALYILAILVSRGITINFFPEFEVARIIAMAITGIELKSVDENMKSILGYGLFEKVMHFFKRK